MAKKNSNKKDNEIEKEGADVEGSDTEETETEAKPSEEEGRGDLSSTQFDPLRTSPPDQWQVRREESGPGAPKLPSTGDHRTTVVAQQGMSIQEMKPGRQGETAADEQTSDGRGRSFDPILVNPGAGPLPPNVNDPVGYSTGKMSPLRRSVREVLAAQGKTLPDNPTPLNSKQTRALVVGMTEKFFKVAKAFVPSQADAQLEDLFQQTKRIIGSSGTDNSSLSDAATAMADLDLAVEECRQILGIDGDRHAEGHLERYRATVAGGQQVGPNPRHLNPIEAAKAQGKEVDASAKTSKKGGK